MASHAASTAPRNAPYIPAKNPSRTGRRCSVCDNPGISEINTLLALNQSSAASIAARFDLSTSSIHRHRAGCIPVIIERERAAAVASRPPEVLPIVLAAKEARLRRLQMYAEAQDKILAEKGLVLTKKTKAGRATVTEESYNQKLVSDAVLLHAAIRAELGETASTGAARNQTVVFMPGSLAVQPPLPTAQGARGLLAEAAAASVALAGPEVAQGRISVAGRSNGRPASPLPDDPAQHDLETVTVDVTEADDTL